MFYSFDFFYHFHDMLILALTWFFLTIFFLKDWGLDVFIYLLPNDKTIKIRCTGPAFSRSCHYSFLLISQCLVKATGLEPNNHLVCKFVNENWTIASSLAKWLSVYLQTKWLWVRILLLPLKFQISRLFWASSSLTFSQL